MRVINTRVIPPGGLPTSKPKSKPRPAVTKATVAASTPVSVPVPVPTPVTASPPSAPVPAVKAVVLSSPPRPVQPRQQSVVSLSRTEEINALEKVASAVTSLSGSKNLITRLLELATEYLNQKRKPRRWTFDMRRDEHGVLSSIEATEHID